ncbi:MAG TPA: C10 family peptidase [Edaphocola sp.]|nr:C10 family peptidase [Edaphocola sp.]
MKRLFQSVNCKSFLVGLALILTYSACKKTEVKSPNQNYLNSFWYDIPNDSFLIDQNEVMEIAKHYDINTFLYNRFTSTNIREFDNYYILYDTFDAPALYVFNYSQNNGTLIFAADSRFESIVYFSEKGNINYYDTLPATFAQQFNSYIKKIEALRYNSEDIDSDTYLEQARSGWDSWNNLNDITNKCCLTLEPYLPVQEDPCMNWEPQLPYIKGPLITSQWGQSNPYNRLNGYLNNCGIKAYNGCVAVAAAQIVRYHEPITSYNFNYSTMNDIINYSDPIGEPDRLLHNCYNFCKLWETCNYTASLNWKAQITLTDKFNMEATHDGTANPNNVTIRQRIINNIEVNRPVILGGAPEGLFSFPNINESHSWIAHGYKYLKPVVIMQENISFL